MNPPVVNHASRMRRPRVLALRPVILARLALLLPALLTGVVMRAQETKPPQAIHRTGPRYRTQSLDERVRVLARYLDLNEEQKSALKKILVENQQELLNMRRAPAPAETLQMDRFRAIQDKTVEKIRGMLTEEQRKKYEPLGTRNSSAASQSGNVDDWLKQMPPR
jgi:hypothetical protein